MGVFREFVRAVVRPFWGCGEIVGRKKGVFGQKRGFLGVFGGFLGIFGRRVRRTFLEKKIERFRYRERQHVGLKNENANVSSRGSSLLS